MENKRVFNIAIEEYKQAKKKETSKEH